MKTLALSLFALLTSFLLVSVSSAALPEETQIVQAESMTLDGNGWTVREHSPDNWYTGRPVGQMLGGQNNQPGTAATTLQIPAAGKYRIWVRFLDMVNYRSKSAFLLSGTQQDKRVTHKEFDNTEVSPRSTPEGEKKWGTGFARWIWDFVEFDAAAGELQVAVEKIHLASVHGCTRTLDLLLLTADPDYEPVVTDLAPLYVKVRMLPGQKEPVVIHFWGRRPFSPWYTPHANINQKGIFLGMGTGSENKLGIRMAAGEESVWVDVAPCLAYGGLNQISLYAMPSYYEPESESHFEVLFSKTPSEAGLIKKTERNGTGDGLIFAVDLVDYRLITESEGSEASLEMAKATPAVAGKIPTEFPFFTGMALTEQRSTARAIAREREALRRIGIDNDKKRPSNYFFHLTKSPGCLSQPDRKRIDESMQAFPAGRGKVIVVGFFPAISYIATSERAAGAEHSTLDFDAAHRDWMRNVLAAGNIQPRLRTDNYRVEANWIQSPDADLIAISNWTGHEQTIVVELDNAPAYREIVSITGKIVSKEDTDAALRVQLSVAAGDLIQLKK